METLQKQTSSQTRQCDIALEGNGSRPSHQGGGWNDSGVMYTLNSVEQHSVLAAGFSFGQSSHARSLGYQEEVSPTIRGGDGGNQKPCVVHEPILLESNQNSTIQTSGISTTLPASMGMGGGYVPMVYENHSQDSRYRPLGDTSETVNAKYGTGGEQSAVGR